MSAVSRPHKRAESCEEKEELRAAPSAAGGEKEQGAAPATAGGERER